MHCDYPINFITTLQSMNVIVFMHGNILKCDNYNLFLDNFAVATICYKYLEKLIKLLNCIK